MKSKVIVGVILTLLPMSLLILTSNFQSVKADPGTVISLNPRESIVQLGERFTIDVNVTEVTDLGCWEFKLNYDTAILNATYVSPTYYTKNNTDWVPTDAFGKWWPDRPPTIDDTIGRVWCGALVPAPLGGGLNGSFPLVTINFTATEKGTCTLDLYATLLGDSYGTGIPHTAIDGSITVMGISDITPPTWSNAGTNNTIGGQPTLFHVKWTDNVGLSGFIFGTDNTGTWTNDTWTPMSGTTDWSNVTKILNSNVGVVVKWRVWANDTSNNWNDTGMLTVTVSPPPPVVFPVTVDGLEFNVIVESNSTVSDFDFRQGDKEIRFSVAGPDDTVGFCNVTIPMGLMKGQPWLILVDDVAKTYDQSGNGTHTFLYFTYTHTTHNVKIRGTWVVPELASWIAWISVIAITSLTVVFGSRKLQWKKTRARELTEN